MNTNKRVPYGNIKPLGSLKAFMEHDLKDGYIGHLDELLPYNIGSDDIYGKDRRTTAITDMDLGLRQHDGNLSGEYMWWNSEGQGNWMDGFVRTAFITDIPEMKEKAEKWVKHYLDTVDEDGYFGIYKPEARFKSGKESGELWAQSTMLRCFTAWYEYTKNEKILEIIKSACDRTMEGYPIGKSRPFSCMDEPAGTSCGGLSHGLTITDTYYFLYKETGEKKYIDYAVWLYESASDEPIFHSDIPYRNMLNKGYRLMFHGVHTYEHIRALAIAKHFGNDEKYNRAYEAYLKKVEPCLTPSGGPTGNEWISGNYADATKYGYEYCSIQELFHSWVFLYELTGNFDFLEKAERLFWNAGFGAHHPTESLITYLKTDNSYRLLSAFDPKDIGKPEYIHYGYKYSPTHQDMAVCCVPNAGRLFPYYVSASWQKTEQGLIKLLYAPSVIEENINGNTVKITEDSNFPYSGKMKFTVETDKASTFTLSFRKPEWCDKFECTLPYVISEDGNIISITKEWTNEDFTLNFIYEIKENEDLLGEIFLTYGPMVMALDIPSREIIAGTHTLPDFYDKEYAPLDEEFRGLIYLTGSTEPQGENISAMFKNSDGDILIRQLVPMGKTILRRVTFPISD